MNNRRLHNLAISSVHLNDRESLLRSIEYSKKLGFWGMEIFGAEIVSGYLTEPSELDRVRETAERHEFALTVHPWFDWVDLTIDEATEQLKALIQRCQRLGATHVNVHLNFFSNPEIGVKRVADIINGVQDDLQKSGFILCFENVPSTLSNPLGSDPETFETFFDLLDHAPFVALTIDTGHAHISGNLDALLTRLASRWAYTHLADNMGSEDSHFGPGMGSIDWNRFARGVAEANYDGPLIVEFSERYLKDSQETLQQSFAQAQLGWNRLDLSASAVSEEK